MTPLRTFVLLALLQSPLAADDESAIRKTIDSWTWTGTRPETVEPEADGSIVIAIAYKKPFIVDDTDSYGVRLTKTEKQNFYGYWGRGKSRCGPNGGCSGAPRLDNITKEGFQVIFDLHWSNKQKGNGTFTENFDCKWLPEQRFTKDGFDIQVTITQNKNANGALQITPLRVAPDLMR